MKAKFSILFLLISTFAFSQEWHETYAFAEKKVQNTQKKLLLVFSGSDWCAPCIRLDRQLFQSKIFEEYAKEHLVLYKADFPRKKANRPSKEVEKINKRLIEQYNPEGYFPLAVLLDDKGAILINFGYENKAPEEYISLLNSVQK
ncbi:thioredoxin family protein [Maribacter sp. 2304DJ31-5]|uniref:thioredoxin family protein n=1 Tax=Maribacter sp. 2304DJ31-5 TaxID=3386273 RepID=UPI0039BD90FC